MMMRSPDRLEHLTRLAQHRLGINLSRAGLAGALERFAERTTCHAGVEEAAEDYELRSDAFQALVDAVTVQHSWLFRDRQQLEAACSMLTESAGTGTQRVWVPACATGEEVYSLAALTDSLHLSVELLGTDVNASAVEYARRARYGRASTRHLPPEFEHMLASDGALHRVVEHLRGRARFEVHNLLDAPPRSSSHSGKWDLIVCRNVLIYFTQEHATRVLTSLQDALAPGGTLVLGASDILTELPPGLTAHQVGGRLVFRRNEGAASGGLPHWTPPLERVSTPLPQTPPRSAPLPGRVPAIPPMDPASLDVQPDPDEAGDEDLETAVSHLLEGIERHLAGDLHGAVKELRASLFLAPRLWPASYYLALTYEGLGRVSDARRAYAEVTDRIDADEPLPDVGGHDFAFLRRDIAAIARHRCRA